MNLFKETNKHIKASQKTRKIRKNNVFNGKKNIKEEIKKIPNLEGLYRILKEQYHVK